MLSRFLCHGWCSKIAKGIIIGNCTSKTVTKAKKTWKIDTCDKCQWTDIVEVTKIKLKELKIPKKSMEAKLKDIL